MASLLKDLTGDAKRTMESFDEFQKGVDQNQAATESLLAKGRASGQVPLPLLLLSVLSTLSMYKRVQTRAVCVPWFF